MNQEFLTYLSKHTLIGIKAGKARTTFLEIWMVEVDGRVFARSWSKNERSWFTSLLIEGIGEVKFGDQIISITGRKVDPDDPIQKQIDDAYLKKYDQPHNVEYAIGIAQPSHYDHTMELSDKL